ncbi:MAG TPA: PKD domain-containing protein, partial [Bacteroidia bacterium]|nr:PKD domain-containing protein [Bacteroidia bacterium]
PTVNFSATPACNSEPSLFSDLSSVANGNIIGYEWYFGDGTILDGNPTEAHIYPTDGNYDVMLKVTTDHQCIDSASGVVSIWELPVADFNAGILSGCEPLEVPLQSVSAVGSGWIAENDWLVGLFVRDSTVNPTPTLMAGIYDVSLIATTDKGCKDTLTRTDYVEVFPLPKPDFIHSPEPATVYNPEVSFYDITPNILSRSWNFSDGNTSGLLNPRHYFSGKGVYPVELFVISNDGCENSIIKPVEIIEIFTVFFPNAFTPNGDGINDYYSGMGSNIKEIELFIFNRWGEMVFKGSGKEPKWDGKGATGEITEGVYTWRAKIKDEEGEAYEKAGSVALIK